MQMLQNVKKNFYASLNKFTMQIISTFIRMGWFDQQQKNICENYIWKTKCVVGNLSGGTFISIWDHDR